MAMRTSDGSLWAGEISEADLSVLHNMQLCAVSRGVAKLWLMATCMLYGSLCVGADVLAALHPLADATGLRSVVHAWGDLTSFSLAGNMDHPLAPEIRSTEDEVFPPCPLQLQDRVVRAEAAP